MTRMRIWGEDSDFTRWVRLHPRLPSSSMQFGLTVNDVDAIFHRFLTSSDAMGTREIQSIMHVEVKTLSGKPNQSQLDTLRKVHLFIGKKIWNGQYVRNLGVSFVSFDGTSPDNSSIILWGRFNSKESASVRWTDINADILVGLLRFDLHPDSFSKNTFRRHHKTHKLIVNERQPLGFLHERTLIIRS